jgi:hypothetical protein
MVELWIKKLRSKICGSKHDWVPHLNPNNSLQGLLPCSHHLGTTWELVDTNLVLHSESWRGGLFLPLDDWVGGDQNPKCIHESRAPHLSTEGKK